MSSKVKTSHILILLMLYLLSGLVIWLYQLDKTIQSKLEKGQFTPSIEFYSLPERWFKGQKLSLDTAIQKLKAAGYVESPEKTRLGYQHYRLWDAEFCKDFLGDTFISDTIGCIAFRNRPEQNTEQLQIAAIGETILEVYVSSPTQTVDFIEMYPELFAQYYNEKPVLRKTVELSDVPPACLNALLAVEDADFLEHRGFSLKAIARAFFRNIFGSSGLQGASTITQQLVKNDFLSHERTLKRKLIELAMSILLETRTHKDLILETYINTIYLGQNGPFQVRGYGAASEFYFGKDIENLNIPECALLAAIINSPGRYNPFSKSENALKRRTHVLNRMKELKHIDSTQYDQTIKSALPSTHLRTLKDPAPYYIDSVHKQLQNLNIDITNGLRIYTAMDQKAQSLAQKAVHENLNKLESWFKSLKEKSKTKALQGGLIVSDPKRGLVLASVGGRDFKTSQFNRVLQAKRQVGSIMKPIVYLTALENQDDYTPITLLKDSPFHHEYENQQWSPKNFKEQYFEDIPMYFALKSSLNSATAQLALDVGLEKIIDMARRLGITADIKPVPALSLGAYEMTPFEVLQAYSTISQLGMKQTLSFITHITDREGNEIWKHQPNPENVVSKEYVSILVGILKQVIKNGTGRSIIKSGFEYPAAGKTGTTSNYRDAWFAGFTPLLTTVSWVGYDDNSEHGLTGATGAVPIWLQFMKSYNEDFPSIDFDWSDLTRPVQISIDFQKRLNVPDTLKNPLTPIELIFLKNTLPF